MPSFSQSPIDLFIIGGGINGTAIAADAAGRGLSVTLIEKNDLSSGTSSASTKLIHGGLRYLELGEFSLVKESLREREILMQRAPNLVTPLEFILPQERTRSSWLVRLGLFLYDYLFSKSTLPKSHSVDLSKNTTLTEHFKKGFTYYDCATDDARLVILNALLAKEHHATILTRTEFISAVRTTHHWDIQVKDSRTDKIHFYQAKALINAAGPFVKEIHRQIKSTLEFDIELIKGSHIIVPKLYSEKNAYILQNSDKRVIFTIPFHDNFTLIGTTDIRALTPESPQIDEREKNYLCDAVNQHFSKKISLNDIVWSYSGIRCLQASSKKNPAKITRDYKLLLEEENSLPLLTVIGGKLTTHRALAEQAVNELSAFFPKMGPAWTETAPLPGCHFSASFDIFKKTLLIDFPWLPESLAERYVINYGTRAYDILIGAMSVRDLGEDYGAGLFAKEVAYLVEHEWAETIEDILWRRTKLGLVLTDEQRMRIRVS